LEVSVPFAHRKTVAELAAGVSSQCSPRAVDAGGVTTYGTSVAETWPRMPILVDKILKAQWPFPPRC
jgi:putative tryptophan/tyrosine transport system substrate-binding protein